MSAAGGHRPDHRPVHRLALRAALAAGLLALLVGALPGSPLGFAAAAEADGFRSERGRMVEQQVAGRGIEDRRVLAAMEAVPRHLFVPESSLGEAYDDKPLPIGHGQTISQPYVVALMTELLQLDAGDKVLEIGTGSGYHTAVLSRVAGEVYSIEIIESMSRQASRRLSGLGYDNVHLRVGDGYKGWATEAPFDAIILTAAPPRIPQPLIDQLKVGGRMVAPVGGYIQDLQVITRTEDGIEKRAVIPVRLVPMTGQVREGE